MISRLFIRGLSVFTRWRTFGFALGLLLFPLIAFAQDEHEHGLLPIDPQTRATQLWVYGVVGLGVVLFLVWYFIRRWQIRNGPSVSGTNQNQD
jgi:hypothetical protein